MSISKAWEMKYLGFPAEEGPAERPAYDARTDSTTYLKVIGPGNKAQHGGDFDYTEYLPRDDGSPGPWLPDREAHLCVSGWHWTDPRNLWSWMKTDSQVYVAEPYGELRVGEDKYASSSGRLLARYRIPPWEEEAHKNAVMMRAGLKQPEWLDLDGSARYDFGAACEGAHRSISDARTQLEQIARSKSDEQVLMLALMTWPGKFTVTEAIWINYLYFLSRRERERSQFEYILSMPIGRSSPPRYYGGV